MPPTGDLHTGMAVTRRAHLAAHDERLVAAQSDAPVFVSDGCQLTAILAAEWARLRRLERLLVRGENLHSAIRLGCI